MRFAVYCSVELEEREETADVFMGLFWVLTRRAHSFCSFLLCLSLSQYQKDICDGKRQNGAHEPIDERSFHLGRTIRILGDQLSWHFVVADNVPFSLMPSPVNNGRRSSTKYVQIRIRINIAGYC